MQIALSLVEQVNESGTGDRQGPTSVGYLTAIRSVRSCLTSDYLGLIQCFLLRISNAKLAAARYSRANLHTANLRNENPKAFKSTFFITYLCIQEIALCHDSVFSAAS